MFPIKENAADQSHAEPLHATVHGPISSKYCFHALLGRLI